MLLRLFCYNSLEVFDIHVPIITQKVPNISGLDISGFKFNGNGEHQEHVPTEDNKPKHGKGYHDLFGFSCISKSKFYDLDIRDSLGDGCRIDYFINKLSDPNANDLEFHHITSDTIGHDLIHVKDGRKIKVHDCNIKLSVNNFVRVRDCIEVDISNNKILGTTYAYCPGIQVQGESRKVSIHDNWFENIYGPAVWLVGGATPEDTPDISIYNNIIYNLNSDFYGEHIIELI
jgi:hypothetical protein